MPSLIDLAPLLGQLAMTEGGQALLKNLLVQPDVAIPQLTEDLKALQISTWTPVDAPETEPKKG